MDALKRSDLKSSKKIADSWIERLLIGFLGLSIVSLLLLSGALIYFLTLSFDEAWLLSHYSEIVHHTLYPWKMAVSSLTNGGAYVLIGIILQAISGHYWIHRLLSYLSLLATSYFLWKWGKRRWHPTGSSLIVLAFFLGMWGTVELSAMAYGEVPSTFFMLIGLSLFLRRAETDISWREVLLSGVFLGFAASSRLNMLLVFPAIIFESFVYKENRFKRIKEAFLATFFGGIVLLICQVLLIYLSYDTLPNMFGKTMQYAGFEEWWPDYPRILNKWIVANGFLPLFLMIGITFFAFLDSSSYSRFFRILVIFGWLHWLLWVIRAPIAHLRYLWPTLAAFAITGGFALASMYVRARDNAWHGLCCAVLAAALGAAVMGLVHGFRSLIHGEANIIIWEWSREAPLSKYRMFRYQPDQQKMADYLAKNVRKGEVVGVLGVDLEMEILTGVKVVPIAYYMDGKRWKDSPLPNKILITPMIGHYLYLDPALTAWMERNLRKEAQFGRYVLYRMVGNYPDSPSIFKFNHSPHPSYPLADPFF